MPRATANYPFEGKVWSGLVGLGDHLLGRSGEGFGFTATLDDAGRLTAIYAEEVDPDFRKRFKEAASSLFYDPFEGPVYTYIAWTNVPRTVMQRLLKIDFQREDFTGRDGQVLDAFPASHGVMF